MEIERIGAIAPGSDYPVIGEEILVLVHATLAYEALQEGDLRKADELIAECVKMSPNNPVSVYLTGERLAANGEWEKAADSLEASAANAKDKWFAERLSQRARALRDGKGSSKSLVLDAGFLIDISAHYVGEAAKDSEAARKLESLWDEAGATGKRLVEKLGF